MADSTKLYSVISGLYDGLSKLNDRKNEISAVLSGYDTPNAVSSAISDLAEKITGLENAGGNAALTGVAAGTGISVTEKANHSQTITVTGYDAITGALVGYDSSTTVANAIDTALTSAKTYANELSSAVSGAAKNYADGLNTAMNTRVTVLESVSGNIQTNSNDIDTLEAALAGYTGANAVSGEFATINGKLATIQGADTVDGSIAKALKDAKAYTDTASGALNTRLTTAEGEIDTIQSQLGGIAANSTVTSYVDTKVADAFGDAITGVVAATAPLSIGVNGQNISAALAYGTTLKVSDSKLETALALSAVQSANGQTTEFALVDESGNKIGNSINIATESILSTATYSKAASDGTGYAAGDDILTLVFKTGTGSTTTVVNMKDLINADELDAQVTTKITELSTAVFVGNDSLSSEFRTDIDNINSNVGTLSDLSGSADKDTIVASLNSLDAAIDTAEAAAQTAVSTLEGKLSAAWDDDEIVIGTGTGIENSGYKLGLDNDVLSSSSNANTVATEKAVAAAITAYDNTITDDLLTNIQTLNGKI